MAIMSLELLVGRRVFSKQGESIGHIEEIGAEMDGEDLVITEFRVGIFAAFERLSTSAVGISFLDLFGLRRRAAMYRIAWDELDLSNPTRPRLLCQIEELRDVRTRSAL
ncbi:hypothetical protein [Rhizobium sp. IBUN]|uniref:hypothetical protein n=1 Tax=Rhizobium sp. IBUN TaxID=1042326 RepID=UPI00040F820C|nr:hypothetical protein [Rhizobium sp. IBUN]